MSFKKRISIEQVEEGIDLAPKFDEKGVIPCITIHAETKEVLMFAYMNEEAMKLTISSGYAHYWSRSRKSIWKKGETSGMVQKLDRMLIDDDQDSLVIEVFLTGPDLGGNEASCHVGYRSCFYREVPIGASNLDKPLKFIESKKSFDPEKIYKDIPNPTKL
ncbi:MAG TPA: phosphoribosyl-AMP cyclohydrolase [Alphaproteobacteria bacterium]|jgi:phosphoribosyl-AMP cyclohydrolase|nr:phosphoribosyl-AMP cyclohydrolase [Alphaproteobacteria bacterium]HIK86947.1 phosphoribosyl-AMP cyclohydrolase [Alphaproteobacteria bacterium]|tara:strand:- start:2465 stop:2947 length:483 start_codon:yes stop_codon:yes gene_type:complete